MKIYISSKLIEKLNVINYSVSNIKLDFYNLKSGYISETDFFGKDVPNINSEYVKHVHIIPDKDDPQLSKWMLTKNHYNRTSDNLLFYADGGKSNYLLITIVKPKGHSYFNNREFLLLLEQIAENFVEKNIIP